MPAARFSGRAILVTPFATSVVCNVLPSMVCNVIVPSILVSMLRVPVVGLG